jgi:WD40 repeat protein
MRILALNGQSAEALAQYAACRRALSEELGLEPSAETARLADAIRAGTLESLHPDRLLPAAGDPPYRGLHYFDVEDAWLFFGREALTTFLAQRVAQTGMLIIVGESGCGKSSLVRAGIAAQLKSQGWDVQVMNPTADPQKAISQTTDWPQARPEENRLLSSRLSTPSRRLLVVDQFEELFSLCHEETARSAFLEQLFGSWGTGSPGCPAMILVLRADFYSHCAAYPLLREALSAHQEYIGPLDMAGLRQAIEAPSRRGGWALEPGLVERLLQDVGATACHPPEPGALPLLEHALLETWLRRRGHLLTLEGYQEVGGVREAIARTADRVYACLSPAEQALARGIFLRLVEPSGETQDTRRRASLSELLLLNSEGDGAAGTGVAGLLDALVCARLVTLSQETAEIAHEALIREWPLLQNWLAEDRESLRLHRHLAQSAAAWERLGRDTGDLYRGGRLTQALEWVAQPGHEPTLGPLERVFLDTSRARAEAESCEREALHQRELEAARRVADAEYARAEAERQRAEEQKQAALRIYREERLATANELAAQAQRALESQPDLSLLLALEAVDLLQRAGWGVPWQVQQAIHDVALTSRLIWMKESAPSTLELAYLKDGSRVLWWDIEGVHQADAETGAEEFRIPGINLELSPDDRLVAITGCDPEVGWWAELWERSTVTHLATIPLSNTWHPWWIIKSFSQDGKHLLVGTTDHKGLLLDLSAWVAQGMPGGVTLSPPAKQIEDCSYFSFKYHFNPDGKTVVTGSAVRPALTLYDLETLTPVREFTGLAGTNFGHCFGPDGARQGASPFGHCFSPDGARLAAVFRDCTVRVWEVASGRELARAPARCHLGEIFITYSPDGACLATSADDGLVTLWDAADLHHLFELYHPSAVYGIAFSPDGRRVFTTRSAGSVQVWDVTPGGRGELGAYRPGDPLLMQTMVFTPGGIYRAELRPDGSPIVFRQDASQDGRYIIETFPRGTVALVDTSTFDEITRLQGWSEPVERSCYPALSRDHTRLALRINGRTRVLDVCSGRLLFETPPGSWAWQTELPPAFSPDGCILASGVCGGAIDLWDLESGEQRLSLPITLGWLSCCAFSPDGRFFAAAGALTDRLENRGYAWIWDLTHPSYPPVVIAQDHSRISQICFHPGSHSLAVCGIDPDVMIYAVTSGERRLNLRGHTAHVVDIRYSADGQFILTASWDGSARVWDAETGAELLHYRVPGNNWFGMAFFTPDGRVIAAGEDGYYRAFAFQDFDALVELVRGRKVRDWKEEERKRYLRA